MERVSVAIRVKPADCVWEIVGNSMTCSSQYSFDHIFGPSIHTQSVYNDFAAEVVQGAISGMNGTIFAYGQTASGKTHTILGNPAEPGLIPLAIDHIFSFIMDSPDAQYLLRVSYLEIYNEIITDLLDPQNTHLKIHESLSRDIYVGNLTERIVTSPEAVSECLALGQRARHVGETNLNESSSRSHTLFRMVIESRHHSGSSVKVSHLNLVDLAGSERAGQTGAEGIRLKEGGHINKSLLTLSNVIGKLSEGNISHIPYRDSKLTRILQNSLGGNAKTAIICTISPTLAAVDESHSTLRFASRAKKIINQPLVNEIISDDALLQRYRREIVELKKKLDEAQTLQEISQERRRSEVLYS